MRNSFIYPSDTFSLLLLWYNLNAPASYIFHWFDLKQLSAFRKLLSQLEWQITFFLPLQSIPTFCKNNFSIVRKLLGRPTCSHVGICPRSGETSWDGVSLLLSNRNKLGKRVCSGILNSLPNVSMKHSPEKYLETKRIALVLVMKDVMGDRNQI